MEVGPWSDVKHEDLPTYRKSGLPGITLARYLEIEPPLQLENIEMLNVGRSPFISVLNVSLGSLFDLVC